MGVIWVAEDDRTFPWQLQRVLHHQGELRSIHPLIISRSISSMLFFHVQFGYTLEKWTAGTWKSRRNVIFQTFIFRMALGKSRNPGTHLIIAGLQVRAAGAGYWEAVWVAKVWRSLCVSKVGTWNKPSKRNTWKTYASLLEIDHFRTLGEVSSNFETPAWWLYDMLHGVSSFLFDQWISPCL